MATMKTFGKHIGLLILAIVMLAGTSCSKVSDISLTSYRIEDFNMRGLRSADVTLSLGIHNPIIQFTLENNSATLYREGVEIGTVDATDVTIPAKTDGVYQVTGTATLSEGMSLLKAMSLVRNFKPEEYTVDIHTTIKLKSGAKFKVNKLGVPLNKLSDN